MQLISGVYTEKILIDDLDDDGLDDYLTINVSHALILTGDLENATIALSAPVSADGTTVDTTGALVKRDGTNIGSINISGTSSTRWLLDENMTVTITPTTLGVGYYSVEYLKEAKDHIDGNIQRGDIVRVYFEAAKPIGEDEELLIKLIPKVGSPTNINLITPDVIVDNKVYLFP
jgi:archaellin